eukprot:3894291-Rhodomonas_salina.1
MVLQVLRCIGCESARWLRGLRGYQAREKLWADMDKDGLVCSPISLPHSYPILRAFYAMSGTFIA